MTFIFDNRIESPVNLTAANTYLSLIRDKYPLHAIQPRLLILEVICPYIWTNGDTPVYAMELR